MWAINPQKVQGPVSEFSECSLVRKDQTTNHCDDVQVFPVPNMPMQLQKFLGKLEYWHSFISHLAQLLRPLYQLTKKGQIWDGERMEQEVF